MKNEDTIGQFLLKEEQHKASLRRRVSESASDYYTNRNLFGLLAGLSLIGFFVYHLVTQSIPIWGLFAFALSVIAAMESKRSTDRIDAMIRLAELERSEPATSSGENKHAVT